MMKQRIWIAVSLFLLLSLALAGCGQPMTAEEIVAKIQETVESTQDAHALVAVDVNAQGLLMSATAEVWEKSPDKVRAVVLDASQSDLVGTTVVSDGQQAWYYEPSRNRVLVGAAGDMDTPLPQEALNGLQEVVQAVLATSDVELVGEEEVAGIAAYKLTASPKEEAAPELFPGDGTATLWVDKERWIVLKAVYEAGSFGQGTMEVRSFELNPGLPEDLFTFVVPEGATVVDVSAQEPVPMTLAEAQAAATFPLLVPGYVPAGATLVEVFKAGDSFVLRYDHSTQISFTVVQGPELAGLPSLGQSQNVTVRGQSATVVSDEAGGNTFLYWTENGVTVTVAGHISRDEALQVAESLE
jgi:outer membrane lipoprotein-sorting protein